MNRIGPNVQRQTLSHGSPNPQPRTPTPGSTQLIVALDVPTLSEAAALVEDLIPVVDWFKVGSELFTSAGPEAVEMVLQRGGRVFLDLKYHDIPHTVAGAVAAAAALGVSMLNVHIAGGAKMLRAAVDAGARAPRPKPDALCLVLGVTLLTSDPDPEAASRVLTGARTARDAGLAGVVASARETEAIKAACGTDFIVVAPGIRPSAADRQDQRRTATPREAVAAGTDYLVVGRPITRAESPRQAAGAILVEIHGAPKR